MRTSGGACRQSCHCSGSLFAHRLVPKQVGYPAEVALVRIIPLDPFRGCTVLGMFVVCFLGAFAVTLALLKHHDTYFSYADALMPQFFFAMGFAYRFPFLRSVVNRGDGVMVFGYRLSCLNLGMPPNSFAAVGLRICYGGVQLLEKKGIHWRI